MIGKEKILKKKMDDAERFFDEESEEGEKCPECGEIMEYTLISTDADGNRPEYGYVCPKCD